MSLSHLSLSHFYTELSSPIGKIVLTADNIGLNGVYFPEHRGYQHAKQGIRDTYRFIEAGQQLNEYFAGSRQTFNLKLSQAGTAFQQQVWHILLQIDYGQTKSYSEVALLLHKDRSARAVGQAVNKNLLGIIVPCHRVIAADGKLTGFAGGLAAKQWLLAHERNF